MKPASFRYVAAREVAEATAALAAEPEAKLLAGGQSLVPMLNFRLLEPPLLVDINRVAGLDRLEPTADGGLAVGALVRHRTVETSALARARFPVLTEAMAHVAHLGVRNRGTFGGSLAHADPAAELPMLALLLEAEITAEGPEGSRAIAAGDFFRGTLTTDLRDVETVTVVTLPGLPPATGWAVEEVARRHGDFALAAVAVLLTAEGRRCAAARIAMAGVGQTPLRAPAAEALLAGQVPDADAIAAAARAAAEAAAPETDLQASADFRRHLVEVLTRRALARAWARAAA